MSQFKRLFVIFGLVVLFLPAIVFFPNKGTSDMDVWLEWSSHIDRWGPLNAYSITHTNRDYERSDYPPISFINLWFALKAAAVGNVSWMIGIKIMILVYYLATWAAFIYLAVLVGKRPMITSAAIASGLFLGGLYFVINSAAFSYLDITYAPFLVFSFALLARKRYLLSGVCFALGTLVKWMPMVIFPAFLFYFINERRRQYQVDRLPMLKFFGGVILTVGLLLTSFLLNHSSLFSFVGSLRKAFIRGPDLGNALNFNWIVRYFIELIYPQTYWSFIRNNFYIFQLISVMIFMLVVIVILKSFIQRRKDTVALLQTSMMISWSYFIWRTGVQENHLFITILAALCLAVLYTNWSNIRLYLWLCLIGLISAVVFFGFPISGIPVSVSFQSSLGIKLTVLLATFHVLIYLLYLRKFLRGSNYLTHSQI